MAGIRPFKALRPVLERAADVASVPYDVVDTEKAKQLARDNPYSFLHVIRPEIDLDDSVDVRSRCVRHDRGAENLSNLAAQGVLIDEQEPCLYLYRLRHMLALSAHAGPVLMTYRSIPEIDHAVLSMTDTWPLYDFTARDGVRHTVWKIDEHAHLVELFRKVPRRGGQLFSRRAFSLRAAPDTRLQPVRARPERDGSGRVCRADRGTFRSS